MIYAFSLAVVITGIAATGLQALINTLMAEHFFFDERMLLVIVAIGLLLRQPWARISAMLVSVLAGLSIFYIGVRGTLNSSDLKIQALWFESTNASVMVLWLICGTLITYFLASYALLASSRSRRYFAGLQR